MSGVAEGLTLGTPISLLVYNKDQKSQDYKEIATKFRPSHADATYSAKYGIRAIEGNKALASKACTYLIQVEEDHLQERLSEE